MASNLKYSTMVRTNRLQALVDLLGNASVIEIYDGTQPANVGTAITTQVLLAELVCGSPLGTVTAGVMTAGAITNDSSANNSGTASWFRHRRAGSPTEPVIDGSVSTSGADLNLNSVSITTGQTVSISSYVLTGGNA
jgi:hypothetical protein